MNERNHKFNKLKHKHKNYNYYPILLPFCYGSQLYSCSELASLNTHTY